MWVQPTTLAPASGFSPCARFLRAIRAGISEREETHRQTREETEESAGRLKEFPSFILSAASTASHHLARLKEILMLSGVFARVIEAIESNVNCVCLSVGF